MDAATILGSGQGGGPGLLPHRPPALTTLQNTLLWDARNLCVSACERDIKVHNNAVSGPAIQNHSSNRHRWPWLNSSTRRPDWTVDHVRDVLSEAVQRHTSEHRPSSTAMRFYNINIQQGGYLWIVCLNVCLVTWCLWLWSLRFNWTNPHSSHSLHHLPLSSQVHLQWCDAWMMHRYLKTKLWHSK